MTSTFPVFNVNPHIYLFYLHEKSLAKSEDWTTYSFIKVKLNNSLPLFKI